MGSVHLEALRRAEGVRLAGVVEPFEPTRARVAETGIATYESVELLLAASANQNGNRAQGLGYVDFPAFLDNP